MNSEREHLRELLIFDEGAKVIEEAARVKELLMLTEEGKVLPKRKVPEGLPYLYIYMLGRAMSKALGLTSDDTFTLGEITMLTGLRGDELLRTLSSSPYIIYVANGRYCLNTLLLSDLLNELEKIVGGESVAP
ncbi:MAG: hypothetical protein QW059_06110 [Nitrososphaerota archaeon]